MNEMHSQVISETDETIIVLHLHPDARFQSLFTFIAFIHSLYGFLKGYHHKHFCHLWANINLHFPCEMHRGQPSGARSEAAKNVSFFGLMNAPITRECRPPAVVKSTYQNVQITRLPG